MLFFQENKNILFSPLHRVLNKKSMVWSLFVANTVNDYFKQPYTEPDESNEYLELRCLEGIVHRPNHSLAHGLRQSYLGVDIALLLSESGAMDDRFSQWLKGKLKKDKNFLKKLEFTNAFQRTGRQSEVSAGENPEKFAQYLLADQENFQSKVAMHIGPGALFKNQEEVDVYKSALIKKFDEEKPEDIIEDVFYLSKIFYAAHLLDLRRLPHFEKKVILKNVSLQLFGSACPNNSWEKECIDNLWAYSGSYLHATGDRDMDDAEKFDWNPSLFYKQAHEPELLVQALHSARIQNAAIFKTIVHRAQVMSELKQELRSRTNSSTQNFVADIPYTASEAYLKILLADKYQEIPQNADSETVQHITTQNIKAFLLSKIENPDDDYINTLVKCLIEERNNCNQIVLYHTTEPELAFLYDVYTELRSQLAMESSHDIRILRALDKAFLELDQEIRSSLNIQNKASKATVEHFLKKFTNIRDIDTENDENGYQVMGLSTNFALMGSDQEDQSDSYNMFYKKMDRTVTINPPNYQTLFDHVASQTGIRGALKNNYKTILQDYVLNSNLERNRRLIQIFICPDVLNEVAYPAVKYGYPIIENQQTPFLIDLIMHLRKNPTEFQRSLKHVTSNCPDHSGPLELQHLQARLFMRPEIMLSQDIQIKSYWRFPLSQEKNRIYRQEIKDLVTQSIEAWLEEGMPAEKNVFSPESVKLPQYSQAIFKGITGKDLPKASPPPLEVQFIKLLKEKNYCDAARLLQDHYSELFEKKFIITSYTNSEELTLREVIKRFLHPDLLEVAFDKGVFPGGKEACALAQSSWLDDYMRQEFLDLLPTFKHLESICTIWNLCQATFTNALNAMLKVIDQILKRRSFEYVKALLKESMPLFELTGNLSDYGRTLRSIHAIRECVARQEIIKEICDYITEACDKFPIYSSPIKINAIRYSFKDIITTIKNQRKAGLSTEDRKAIWSQCIQEKKEFNWDNYWNDIIQDIKIISSPSLMDSPKP